jgi:hypothetical protein
MPSETRPSRLRADGLTWQVLGDAVVVLDLATSQYLQLNTSGAVLFQLLADGADDAGLALALEQRYGLAPEAAVTDVADFLADLRAQGLLA